MSMIRVESVGGNYLDRANKVLAGIQNGGGAIKAVYQAAKRAAQKGKTEAGRFAAATYSISKGAFMAKCKIQTNVSGGSGGAASVSISFAGSVIPLIEFDTKYSRGGGVTTTVKGASATLEHAFIAPVYGSTQAHEHVNGTTGGVKTLYGPSTGQMMQDEGVSEQMSELIMQTFEERIDHEISRILAGI